MSYSYKEGYDRIIDIFEKSTDTETVAFIPSKEKLTFNNGFMDRLLRYLWI